VTNLRHNTAVIEDRVEHREHDVSSCGVPDRWVGRTAATGSCQFLAANTGCCLGLTSSLQGFGDDPLLWCSTNLDQNHCH